MVEGITYDSTSLSRVSYLTFSAIQLMTLGWMQSAENSDNAVATGDYTGKVFSFSLGVSALTCIWKAFSSGKQKAETLEDETLENEILDGEILEGEPLTHEDLIQLGIALGYPAKIDSGICLGFSFMWAQAILALDEETFYKRLRLISLYKNNFKLLIEEIEKARSKKGINLTLRDQQLLEIPACFDGWFLYQKPGKYKAIFNQDLTQNNTDIIYSYTQSAMLTNNANCSLILKKCYIFNPSELERYLNDLSKILKNFPSSTPIVLRSDDHAISLRYHPEKQCWEYLDINDLQQTMCYQNLDTKGVVKHIMRSFADVDDTLFNIKIYSTIPEEKINSYFEELDKKYCIKQEDINRVNNRQLSLLHLAGKTNDLPLLKHLIALKANLNQANHKGITPLQSACLCENREIIKELLKNNADPNQADHKGRTPLQIACAQGNLEIVEELLKHKAEPNQADHKGITPLGIACAQQNLEITKELLKHKADPNQADHKGRTPLQIADIRKNLNLIKELRNHNVHTADEADSQSIIRLQSACGKDNPALKKLLTNRQNDLIAGIPSCENSRQKNNATQFTMNLIDEVGKELKDINKNPEIISVKKIGEVIENNLEKFKKGNPTSTLLEWACNGILNLWNAIRTFVIDQSRSIGRKIGSVGFFNYHSHTKKIIVNLNETQEKITKLVNKERGTCDEINKRPKPV